MNKGSHETRKATLALFLLSIIAVSGCTSTDSKLQTAECKSDWACGAWSACARINATSGMQNRTCSDVNNCNSTIGKPPESQSCVLPPFTTKEPSEIALHLSDFPESETNWTLKERTERVKSELGNESLLWGWEKGYKTSYYRIGGKSLSDVATSLDTTYIEQWISFYPIDNITKTLRKDNSSFYNQSCRLPILSEYNVTCRLDDLSDPRIGNQSIAYRNIYTYTNGELTYYYIEFYKLNVYELILMRGETLDYELLKDLAKKAALKID